MSVEQGLKDSDAKAIGERARNLMLLKDLSLDASKNARDVARRARLLARRGSWTMPGTTGPQADVRGTRFVGQHKGSDFTGLAVRELNHPKDPEQTIVGIFVREGRDPASVDREVARIFPDGRVHPPEFGITAVAAAVMSLQCLHSKHL